jgi:hypothetical protein
MKNKKKLLELEDKVAKGLEEAYRKMVEFKKYKKSPIIVSRDGKVVEIDPEEISPTTVYKR